MERLIENTASNLDYFIAYAKEDYVFAEDLYQKILKSGHSVFLDKKCIKPGDDWTVKTLEAQKHSSITIALISGNTTQSHYAREEIHTALKFVRQFPDSYKIIPVYLNESLNEGIDILYGLRLIQGITYSPVQGFDALIPQISEILATCKIRDKEVSSQLTFDHPLLQYPKGPLVPGELIPRVIISNYAKLIRQAEISLVINETNSFRREVDPQTPYIIDLSMIIPTAYNAPFFFWMDVFDYARLQGPRMLAALLLMIPDDQFDEKARSARLKLLEQLKNHK